MLEHTTISVERLRELEEMEEMHKQMKEDGEYVDAKIKRDLEAIKEKAIAHCQAADA
jgi:hypothetical protein